MRQRYEYKFVRLGESYFGVGRKSYTYEEVIYEHAEKGWRLVQIFSPPQGSIKKYFEVILERELAG